MKPRPRDGIISDLCEGEAPFWQVWSHRLEREDPTTRADAEPVLLIHAATLSRNMFLVRDGGFVKALLNVRDAQGKARFDVLTLDWRSSKHLFGNFGEKAKNVAFDDYRLEKVVSDVRSGVRVAAGRHRGGPVHVVAHCIGATATAQAIATKEIPARQLGHVVLSALALFYRVGLDGVLKTAENLMEGLEAEKIHALSPYGGFEGAQEWPDTFKKMYEMWCDTIFPHGCGIELCNRLWFMYGGDYRAENMEDIHESRERMSEQFGAMPVGLYRHIIDNCRRGWAATFGGREVLDPEPFRELSSLLLMTGSENQVWHRDSIDRMHEWLHRELGTGARAIDKKVFDRYGHVDLWWGHHSNRDVFSALIRRLTT